MKPKDSSREYCIGAGRRKLRFETQEKADRHIQWANKDPSLSKKLERSYYCPFCLSWHVTSVRDGEKAQEKDQVKLNFLLNKAPELIKIELPKKNPIKLPDEVPMISGFLLDKSRELKELAMTLEDWHGIENIREVLWHFIHQTSGSLRNEIEQGMGKLRIRVEELKRQEEILRKYRQTRKNISDRLEELESLKDIEKLKYETVKLSLESKDMTPEELGRLEKLNEKILLKIRE